VPRVGTQERPQLLRGLGHARCLGRRRTTYNDIKIREFKTISGVVSFFIGLGFAHVDLPFEAGTSRTHKLAPSDKAKSDKTTSDKGAGN